MDSTNAFKKEDRRTRTGNKTYDMACIAFFAALLAVCSWITIPMTVPFTLQTLGVFLAAGVLGGKRGTLSVLVYILLGAMGAPVFAGFSGGLGALLSNSGGYIAGFLGSTLTVWGMEKLFGRKTWVLAVSMVLGLGVCYTFGTAWFMLAYARTTGAVGLGTVLGWCVIPFVVPDIVKILLALSLSRQLSRFAVRR